MEHTSIKKFVSVKLILTVILMLTLMFADTYINSLPYNITSGGTYILNTTTVGYRANGEYNKNIILIETNDSVVIDMNGKTIVFSNDNSPDTAMTAFFAYRKNNSNVTIKNGEIFFDFNAGINKWHILFYSLPIDCPSYQTIKHSINLTLQNVTISINKKASGGYTDRLGFMMDHYAAYLDANYRQHNPMIWLINSRFNFSSNTDDLNFISSYLIFTYYYDKGSLFVINTTSNKVFLPVLINDVTGNNTYINYTANGTVRYCNKVFIKENVFIINSTFDTNTQTLCDNVIYGRNISIFNTTIRNYGGSSFTFFNMSNNNYSNMSNNIFIVGPTSYMLYYAGTNYHTLINNSFVVNKTMNLIDTNNDTCFDSGSDYPNLQAGTQGSPYLSSNVIDPNPKVTYTYLYDNRNNYLPNIFLPSKKVWNNITINQNYSGLMKLGYCLYHNLSETTGNATLRWYEDKYNNVNVTTGTYSTYSRGLGFFENNNNIYKGKTYIINESNFKLESFERLNNTNITLFDYNTNKGVFPLIFNAINYSYITELLPYTLFRIKIYNSSNNTFYDLNNQKTNNSIFTLPQGNYTAELEIYFENETIYNKSINFEILEFNISNANVSRNKYPYVYQNNINYNLTFNSRNNVPTKCFYEYDNNKYYFPCNNNINVKEILKNINQTKQVCFGVVPNVSNIAFETTYYLQCIVLYDLSRMCSLQDYYFEFFQQPGTQTINNYTIENAIERVTHKDSFEKTVLYNEIQKLNLSIVFNEFKRLNEFYTNSSYFSFSNFAPHYWCIAKLNESSENVSVINKKYEQEEFCSCLTSPSSLQSSTLINVSSSDEMLIVNFKTTSIPLNKVYLIAQYPNGTELLRSNEKDKYTYFYVLRINGTHSKIINSLGNYSIFNKSVTVYVNSSEGNALHYVARNTTTHNIDYKLLVSQINKKCENGYYYINLTEKPYNMSSYSDPGSSYKDNVISSDNFFIYNYSLNYKNKTTLGTKSLSSTCNVNYIYQNTLIQPDLIFYPEANTIANTLKSFDPNTFYTYYQFYNDTFAFLYDKDLNLTFYVPVITCYSSSVQTILLYPITDNLKCNIIQELIFDKFKKFTKIKLNTVYSCSVNNSVISCIIYDNSGTSEGFRTIVRDASNNMLLCSINSTGPVAVVTCNTPVEVDKYLIQISTILQNEYYEIANLFKAKSGDYKVISKNYGEMSLLLFLIIALTVSVILLTDNILVYLILPIILYISSALSILEPIPLHIYIIVLFAAFILKLIIKKVMIKELTD